MKTQIKKWTLRITVTCLFILGLLVGIILHPGLLYAGSSVDGHYTIYHQRQLGPSFAVRLHDADALVRSSELYDGSLQLSVCLNDGPYHVEVIRMTRGNAFGWGIGNDILALGGNMNARDNYSEIRDYKWNLTELIAHEATHCFQFHKYGLWHSNPIARIPEWKWEGYPEYVARKNKVGLVQNIKHLQEVEQTDNNNWIGFADGTGTVIPYYKNWLLVQYCMDIKHMSCDALLKDNTQEELVRQEMMGWYEGHEHH
jgi:hypothetical protein